MDSTFPPSAGRSSRVFRAACALLGLVALAQAAAVAVAWRDLPGMSAPGSVGQSALAEPPGKTLPGGSGPDAALDPFQAEYAGQDDPHPELAVPAGEDPGNSDPVATVLARPPVVLNAPLDVPITDEHCLKLLDEGIYLRERGDMQGAIKELREALTIFPDHPKLIYQVAVTLEQMSLEAKAAVHWRKLRLLGRDAGNYYQLAMTRQKDGGSLALQEDGAAEEEEKEGRFVVRDVKVGRLPGIARGEEVVIEGRLDRKQAEAAEVSSLELKLHLFDIVNGQRIDRTTALPPVIEWLDPPVDWAEGGERFVFEYRQPPFTPDELVKLGQRKYYGYAIEIRYGDGRLQDLAADPSMLADMAREIPEAEPAAQGGDMSDLFSPVATPGQPDAVLFPGDRFAP